MIHAYDKLYLEHARMNFAFMLDFAVNDLGYDLKEYFDLFLSSSYSRRFEEGDFSVLVGRSGCELVFCVLDELEILYDVKHSTFKPNRSVEYWVGWALSYYQWQSSFRFREIVQYVPIKDIALLYSPYHEMDIRQFVDKMNQLIKEAKLETNLKMRRQNLKLSQKDLALKTEIPVRTIQQYEQRQKDINKAQAIYLARLARALNCDVEDLLEKV